MAAALGALWIFAQNCDMNQQAIDWVLMTVRERPVRDVSRVFNGHLTTLSGQSKVTGIMQKQLPLASAQCTSI